jgi:hypothetical protein
MFGLRYARSVATRFEQARDANRGRDVTIETLDVVENDRFRIDRNTPIRSLTIDPNHFGINRFAEPVSSSKTWSIRLGHDGAYRESAESLRSHCS